MSELKTYMVYSVSAGSEEGALLVFAHNCQEAKKVAYRNVLSPDILVDYLDVAVRRLKHHDWLYEEANQNKLDNNIPHVVDVKTCAICEMWGGGRIGDDGLCDDCRGEEE